MNEGKDALEGLDGSQLKAATSLGGAVRIVAGAGAGKTRTITRRIAYACARGDWDPAMTLAVTFSVKAAAEMRARLTSLGVPPQVRAGTFHSVALHQLRRVWPDVSSAYPPQVVTDLRPFVHGAYTRVTGQADCEPLTLRDIQAEIGWAKVGLISPQDYPRVCAAVHRLPPGGLDPERMADLMQAFEKDKAAHNQMDFDDILLLVCHILEEGGQAAASIRSGIGWLTVDEYQDVSPLQHRLLELWMDGHEEVCVVGDPAQTIYSFAGATSYYLRAFPQEYRNMAADIRLDTDYRSTPQVVNCANRLLSRSPVRQDYLKLTSARPVGTRVTTTRYEDDRAEAAGVARRIVRQVEAGARAADFAVLTRINSQQALICAALKGVGLGYRVRADTGWQAGAADLVAQEARALGDLDARRQETAGEMGRVTVSTIHAAKGLEFRHVFIVGCSEGLIPFGSPQAGEELEEERRLMYVGVTRAGDTLHLSFADRKDSASPAFRTASRFLGR